MQTLNGMQGSLSGSASPSFEDGNYRVGKYSMEERKIRIHRYQQKRTQRNFNKKIKVQLVSSFHTSFTAIATMFEQNLGVRTFVAEGRRLIEFGMFQETSFTRLE